MYTHIGAPRRLRSKRLATGSRARACSKASRSAILRHPWVMTLDGRGPGACRQPATSQASAHLMFKPVPNITILHYIYIYIYIYI